MKTASLATPPFRPSKPVNHDEYFEYFQSVIILCFMCTTVMALV